MYYYIWWDHDVLLTYDANQWIEDFRMDGPTFFKLVDLVRDDLVVAENTFMSPISANKRNNLN